MKEFFSGDNNSDPTLHQKRRRRGSHLGYRVVLLLCPISSDHVYQFAKMEAFLGLLRKKKREEKPQTGKASCQLVPFIEICETSRKCKEHLEKFSRVFGGHLIHITNASSKIGETQVASSRGKWPLAPL